MWLYKVGYYALIWILLMCFFDSAMVSGGITPSSLFQWLTYAFLFHNNRFEIFKERICSQIYNIRYVRV